MDPYGNQGLGGRQTDEYGNPIDQGAGGTVGGMMGMGGGGQHQPQRMQHEQQHGGVTGMLHRSGSGSSSSSESDGEGGRRKKGLKEKIKEKLPGGHQEGQQQYGGEYGSGMGGGAGEYDTYGGGMGGGQQHEKKGMMDKIKIRDVTEEIVVAACLLLVQGDVVVNYRSMMSPQKVSAVVCVS